MPGGVAGGGLPPVRSSWKLSQALQCVGTSTQINDRKSFWFAGAGVPVGVPGGAVDCRRAGRASCLDSSRAAAAGRLLSLAVPDRCRRWGGVGVVVCLHYSKARRIMRAGFR